MDVGLAPQKPPNPSPQSWQNRVGGREDRKDRKGLRRATRHELRTSSKPCRLLFFFKRFVSPRDGEGTTAFRARDLFPPFAELKDKLTVFTNQFRILFVFAPAWRQRGMQERGSHRESFVLRWRIFSSSFLQFSRPRQLILSCSVQPSWTSAIRYPSVRLLKFYRCHLGDAIILAWRFKLNLQLKGCKISTLRKHEESQREDFLSIDTSSVRYINQCDSYPKSSID